jgi:AcrR family transcriptional regulator
MNTSTASNAISQQGTRVRILVEASKLFAEAGYAGTSTRDIADAVGIKQPGLYSHFGSKAEVFRALAEASLNPVLELLDREKRLKNPGAVELARLIRGIAYSLAYSDYNPQWMFGPIPYETEFLPLWEDYLVLTKRLEALITKGKKSGEFRNLNPSMGQEIVINLLSTAMWTPLGLMDDWRPNKKLQKRVDDMVLFCLYGLMADASQADKVYQDSYFTPE